MTGTVKAITVILKKDASEDQADLLMNAIKQFSNVLEVGKIDSNLNDHIAESRARSKLTNEIFNVLMTREE